MSASRKTLLALGAVALVQTAVLAWMVIDRVRLIRTGREITLPIVPVDPRDLFRGEYVRLRYSVSRVPMTLVEGPLASRHETIYVVLEKTGAEGWRVVDAARSLPSDGNPDRVILKGRAVFGGVATEMMRYGIESYFVPQGEGRRLEALARDRKLAALVAVDAAGNAAIKGLIIDGKLQYEEPLF